MSLAPGGYRQRKVVLCGVGRDAVRRAEEGAGEGVIGGERAAAVSVRTSKKVALQYLSFYQRYRGLDFSALALGNVYGPRQDPHGEAGVIAIFSARMLAGEIPVIFGDGNQTRDYVFIDDVVHAFALGMDRGSGRLLNIGTGVETR